MNTGITRKVEDPSGTQLTKADVSVGGAHVTLTDRADGWASAALNVLLLLAGTAVGLLPEWRRLRREEFVLRGG